MTQAPDAFNVCGVIIHANPLRVGDIRIALAALTGVEIHTETDDSRFVVTVMDTEEQMAIDQLAAINRIPGVVSATLAYHGIDREQDDQSCCGSGQCSH